MTLPSRSINPLLHESFRKLIILSFVNRLPGRALGESVELTVDDVATLYTDAGHLALSQSSERRNLAFEINSRLAEVLATDHSAAATLSAHLFARLGNFPALDVVRERAGGLGKQGAGQGLHLKSCLAG